MKEDVYRELKDHFEKDDEVVVNSGKGAQGIKFNNKMFIIFPCLIAWKKDGPGWKNITAAYLI